MNPTTVMLSTFAVVGIAAAAVLAPTAASWRRAAEHSRVFWLVWIGGFATLGFAGPASAGLGWVPVGWLALWGAVATLQPSLIADFVEVRRCRGRVAATKAPASRPTSRPGGDSGPAIRWTPPTMDRVGPGAVAGRR